MPFCTHCGSKHSDSDRFCAHCGQQLGAPELGAPEIAIQHSNKNEITALVEIQEKQGLFLVPFITFEKISFSLNGTEHSEKFKYGDKRPMTIPRGHIHLQALVDFGLNKSMSNSVQFDTTSSSSVLIKLSFLTMGTPKLEVFITD